MKFIKILNTLLLFILFTEQTYADIKFFEEDLDKFEKKEFEKAKFKFEQDLVYNPRSVKGYLYLSKIYNIQNNKKLEEKNLDTVILLSPKNEEAIYNLAELKLEESDYNESKNLIDQLLVICKNYCIKGKRLKVDIEKSLRK